MTDPTALETAEKARQLLLLTRREVQTVCTALERGHTRIALQQSQLVLAKLDAALAHLPPMVLQPED
ncbi:hypothetical protein [Laspinema palackyanum]|uniref:hypothetical protein n=1 Tax=Laspinema palackyanum TaxID=3231601 RepID=UPI00345D1187|nr:hypothetical protein [Laspinema sp. D2c]